jgi:hypothetical protein
MNDYVLHWAVAHCTFDSVTRLRRTSIFRVLDKDHVAVARSFCSVNDAFCKKRGVSIAKCRLQSFLEKYMETPSRFSMYASPYYRGNSHTDGRYVLFEVVKPSLLKGEEAIFYHKIIVSCGPVAQ